MLRIITANEVLIRISITDNTFETRSVALPTGNAQLTVGGIILPS